MQEQSEITESSLGRQNPQPSKPIIELTHFSPRITIIFIVLGFYFISFGVGELISNTAESISTFQMRCDGSNICFSPPTFMSFDGKTKVGLYLKMDINQHDISNIQRSDQLIQDFPFSSIQPNCQQYTSNNKFNKEISISGIALDKNARAIPCGYFAYQYPEGTLRIYNKQNHSELNITTKYIREDKFSYQKSIIDYNIDEDKQWIDLKDQRFEQWMQLTSSIKIHRLWGHVTSQIAGNYQAIYQFQKNQPPGKKFQLILQNNKALGGYNIELVVIHFIFACVMFLFSIFSYFLTNKNEKLQDVRIEKGDKMNEEDESQNKINTLMINTSLRKNENLCQDFVIESKSNQSSISSSQS